MDARNEARFFNLLCSIAKGDNVPQYFLLTPKVRFVSLGSFHCLQSLLSTINTKLIVIQMVPKVDFPDNVDFHFIMNGPKVNVPFDESESEDEEESDNDEGIVEGTSEEES